MDIRQISQNRYATQAFNPIALLEDGIINALKTLLQQAPSSLSLQPQHFVFASTGAGKEHVIKSVRHAHPYKESKLTNASHIVVMCVKAELTDDYLQPLSNTVNTASRLSNAKLKSATKAGRIVFKNMQTDLSHWMEKQVYIAMETLLLGSAYLGGIPAPWKASVQRFLTKNWGYPKRAIGDWQ